MDKDDKVVGDFLLDGTKSSSSNKMKVLQSNEIPTYKTGQSKEASTFKTGQSRRRKVFKNKAAPKARNVNKAVSKARIANKTRFKAPRAISVPVASGRVYYNGSYLQKGDIVSVVDDQHRVYYAQINGLLQDQYCEKCACLTWLLPTQSSPKGRFDPDTYIIGHEEQYPRPLDCLEFVCHSPNDYYMKNTAHPEVVEEPLRGFAWTSKGPKIVTLPAKEFNTDSE